MLWEIIKRKRKQIANLELKQVKQALKRLAREIIFNGGKYDRERWNAKHVIIIVFDVPTIRREIQDSITELLKQHFLELIGPSNYGLPIKFGENHLCPLIWEISQMNRQIGLADSRRKTQLVLQNYCCFIRLVYLSNQINHGKRWWSQINQWSKLIGSGIWVWVEFSFWC